MISENQPIEAHSEFPESENAFHYRAEVYAAHEQGLRRLTNIARRLVGLPVIKTGEQGFRESLAEYHGGGE
jgi:hypothetical protein